MDDEAAHHLLRKVSSAGVRHGTAEPAPKSMSWEEFLRQPTAAERASADARAQRGSPPSASDANPTSLRDSRRRRRRAHTVSSTNERPRVHNLALTYDVTAPDEPRSDSPRSPEVATAEASEELALIRDLLEQLVRSQQRIESRLEAVERNTSRR